VSDPFTAADFAAAVPVSRETLARLEAYAAVLATWNRRMNLVGASTMRDPWRRHMADSAQLHAYLPRDCRVLVDIGSGAGFPGLVLAIMGVPEVHLVESNQRKCAFLREVARVTGTRVTIHCARAEALTPWPADVVTARALSPLPILLEYAEPFLTPKTICLFPKGRGVKEELTKTQKTWNITFDMLYSVTNPEGTILRLEAITRDRKRRSS
jgi:16S rRNA (guanine527-N7)-methyltransferase